MAVDACVRPRGRCSCTETVITWTGDLKDPTFERRFRSILKELRGILCKGSDERLRVRKMEPWNSVRVTFSIGVEAAERLRALAEAGGEVLARLGILSVQLPNGQVISVRVSAPSTPPNVVAPAPSSIPPLVPAATTSTSQPQPSVGARFPFNSMAQASAIVSREAKTTVVVNNINNNPPSSSQPQPPPPPSTPSTASHYPPPPYPEVPQASPLLVNLLQTDQASGSMTPRMSGLSRPTSLYPTPGRSVGLPPPPYARPVQSPPRTRLPTPHQPPPTIVQQNHQEPGPTTSNSEMTSPSSSQHPSSSNGRDNTTSATGKTVQYLINPLTGVLEPMSSESESEAEGPVLDCPISASTSPPPAPIVASQQHHHNHQQQQQQQQPLQPQQQQQPPSTSSSSSSSGLGALSSHPPPLIPTVVRTPSPPRPLMVVSASSQLSIPTHPIPSALAQVSLPLASDKVEEEKLIKKAVEGETLSSITTPLVAPPTTNAPVLPLAREDLETTEEDRPKGEEKIKLRLKLEKTESYNLSYKAEGGSEPRVPPLHISLRGRPAVVSRKEKRMRKDDSRERERQEREREREREREQREPLSQGTYEGTCQFPSEAEVASILRSVPPGGGKLLNTTVTARRKRDKKKVSIYPRSAPRVEEKLKKGSGSLLKSVVKSAAKEVRIMTAQRSTKPLQHKKPASPVLTNQMIDAVIASVNPPPETDFKQDVKFKESVDPPRSGSSGSAGGDDSGIESMDALSEKSPNQSTSPLRKEELPKKEKKEEEVEEVVPIRLTPALYTYSNPERQREETPSPDHTEEERFGAKSLLEQLLIDIPNGDSSERRQSSLRRSPEISPTLPTGKRGRRPSESSSDPPTPRPTKRKCSENASELIKACIDDGKRDSMLPQGDNVDSSDDENKRKEEDDRLRMSEEKSSIRSTFNSRRSVRQAEIRERPIRKSSSVPSKRDEGGGKRRRGSKDK